MDEKDTIADIFETQKTWLLTFVVLCFEVFIFKYCQLAEITLFFSHNGPKRASWEFVLILETEY